MTINIPPPPQRVIEKELFTEPWYRALDDIGREVNNQISITTSLLAEPVFDEWISITEFGGAADAVTDNTVALAAAMASLPSLGGMIVFPPAATNSLYYKFNSTINITKNGVKLMGLAGPISGSTSSTQCGVWFRFAGTGDFIKVATGNNNPLLGFEIENIALDGHGVADRCIHLTNTQNSHLVGGFSRGALICNIHYDSIITATQTTGFCSIDSWCIAQQSTGAHSFAGAEAAHGIWLDCDPGGGPGGTMFDFRFVQIIHENGDAIRWDQGDQCIVTRPFTFRRPGGTGHSLHFNGGGSSAPAVNTHLIGVGGTDIHFPVAWANTTNVFALIYNSDVRPVITGAGAGNLTYIDQRGWLVPRNTVGTWNVLASSGVSASHTGDTVETALATVTIPAGHMGLNGSIRINAIWSYTNSANNKILRHRLGGIGGSAHSSRTVTATGSDRVFTQFTNRNAANSQIGIANTDFGTQGAAAHTSAINTAVAQDIVLSGELANSGETITLESYMVEIFYQA